LSIIVDYRLKTRLFSLAQDDVRNKIFLGVYKNDWLEVLCMPSAPSLIGEVLCCLILSIVEVLAAQRRKDVLASKGFQLLKAGFH